MNYFERAIKKHCTGEQIGLDYVDCHCLVATSNTVEKLFSTVQLIMINLRRHMSPIIFEAIIYLRCNCSFWDMHTVAKAMKGEPKVELMECESDVFYGINAD